MSFLLRCSSIRMLCNILALLMIVYCNDTKEGRVENCMNSGLAGERRMTSTADYMDVICIKVDSKMRGQAAHNFLLPVFRTEETVASDVFKMIPCHHLL